jgi:hypothetical protein
MALSGVNTQTNLVSNEIFSPELACRTVSSLSNLQVSHLPISKNPYPFPQAQKKPVDDSNNIHNTFAIIKCKTDYVSE